eukprot:CAMPEP_0175054308 /NCGR_PEP_ID=MMETSP0052_2-20121109/9431_1 /TAXON_ID=51329 ORGANISM="Polytomella parva, Strain SAG 63-3" /NCGR_SAMPLE_ID=MMETSP0052_2 /ASSEMBLY_ACC=CAM_ASM_000194 /LENGTH=690 /DNA_ID=CAMNT_0016318985 /DNA_START=40 /DNA_END=2112 /DNA_ORIENTATION=+
MASSHERDDLHIGIKNNVSYVEPATRTYQEQSGEGNNKELLLFPWQNQSNPYLDFNPKRWSSRLKESWNYKKQNYTWVDWLQMVLPCVAWIRTYKLSYFPVDLMAGIAVGFMVVPQGMSYANLAGLPSVFGLYGAFLPVLAYSLIGSSRQLAVGPVAVTSLLLDTQLKKMVPAAASISSPNTPTPEQAPIQALYNQKAIQVCLIVSCLYTAIGIFRLGFITNFLSRSVIGGFTSGAAVTIGLSQVKYILGVSVPRVDSIQSNMRNYVNIMYNMKWQEYLMGYFGCVLLVTCRSLGRNVKYCSILRSLGPMLVCVMGLVAVYTGDLQLKCIKIVASIPKGLPKPTVSWWTPMDNLGEIFATAIIVMLVDLLESTSIARTLANRNGYELNANQEITGLGIANFVGAIFNCYTTTGSFSRSAVNDQAGAKSPLAAFVAAWVVAIVLGCLTSVFAHVPYNALGAIICTSITNLFQYEQAVFFWKVNKFDFLVWLASFFGVLFITVEIGLAIALGLAIAIVIYESAFPHTALLGRIPNTGVYRNVKQYPDACVVPGITAARIDAPIYFANHQWITSKIQDYYRKSTVVSKNFGVEVEYLLIDMSPVSHVDAGGVHAIEEWIIEYGKEGVQVVLCNPNLTTIRLLETSGVPDLLGREWIFVTVHDAVIYCSRRLQEKGFSIAPVRIEKALDRQSSS